MDTKRCRLLDKTLVFWANLQATSSDHSGFTCPAEEQDIQKVSLAQ